FVVAGKTDATDGSRRHLGAAGRQGIQHDLTVRVSGRAEEQSRAKFATGYDQGTRHPKFSIATVRSAALPRTHDLDRIAGLEGRLLPMRPRDDATVERDRDTALGGVDRLLLEQSRKRRDGQCLVHAVDANAWCDSRL